MKNAYVEVDHLGDDGHVTAGMILSDVANARFETLQKAGLVREATAEEVKAGYTPPFESEADAAEREAKAADEDREDKAAKAPANKRAPEPKNKEA